MLNQAHTQAEHVDSIAASTFWRRGEIGKNTEDVWWRRTVSSGWPQDSLCAYFKAVKQPQGEHDNKEIKSLLGNELGWQKRADDITLCFLCLRAGGWPPRPNPDECASLRPPQQNVFLSSGRMRKSERHAGLGATGVSDALEFYYPRCHKNKCALPGSIHAVPRFHWVNNLQRYFTFISSGWLRANTHIAIFLLACR